METWHAWMLQRWKDTQVQRVKDTRRNAVGRGRLSIFSWLKRPNHANASGLLATQRFRRILQRSTTGGQADRH